MFVDLVARSEAGEEGEWGPTPRRTEQVAYGLFR